MDFYRIQTGWFRADDGEDLKSLGLSLFKLWTLEKSRYTNRSEFTSPLEEWMARNNWRTSLLLAICGSDNIRCISKYNNASYLLLAERENDIDDRLNKAVTESVNERVW
ncbi:MAG: hypothetical protein M1812_005405 [Candelaria pacifica]|nr:MAG: hypothetical protein M1812_005405 [Candelaria pacifica]